jgi:hypothetical protein
LERERWQQRWLDVLDQLIEGYAAAGAWTQALDRRRATADPLRRRHRQMRLHYQLATARQRWRSIESAAMYAARAERRADVRPARFTNQLSRVA